MLASHVRIQVESAHPHGTGSWVGLSRTSIRVGVQFHSHVSGSSKPRRRHLCVPRRTGNPLGDGRCVIHHVPCSNEDTAITQYQHRTIQWATYNGNIQFTCIQNTTITTFLPVPSDCDITLQSLDKNQSDRVLNTSKNWMGHGGMLFTKFSKIVVAFWHWMCML